MSTDPPTTARKRLDSWKEIAEYLGRDVRTAMRWEDLGFPVHRVPGGQRPGVFAIPDEIDIWLATRENDLPDVGPDASAEPVLAPQFRAFLSDPAVVRQHRQQPRLLLALLPALVLTVALVFFLRHLAKPAAGEITFNPPDKRFHFTAASTIPLHGIIGNVVAGDLNHDGWPDLVIGAVPSSKFVVLLNHN